MFHNYNMTSKEFKKWLTKQGCSFKSGKGGHLRVFFGERVSVLPMHGSNQELGNGLVEAIKKQLGLK
jgi:mRNA interferase HicA